MARFFLTATGLLLLASGLTATPGLHLLGMLLFPLPVGVYWAQGRYHHSLGLVGVAALAGFAGTGGSLAMAAAFVVVADIGLILGIAVNRRWSYGQCVAAMTAVLFVLGASDMLLDWEVRMGLLQQFMDAQIATFELEASNLAERDMELKDDGVMLIESWAWMKENARHLLLGGFFGLVLMFSTGFMAIYQKIVESAGTSRLRGSFPSMRVSEWLVWLGIAVAGLWLIDYYWESDALRMFTWNAALGLSVVYWINGLSILTYTLLALQWNPILNVAIVMLVLVLPSFSTIMPAFGLFDTWYDFRAKLDNAIAAYRARKEEQ